MNRTQTRVQTFTTQVSEYVESVFDSNIQRNGRWLDSTDSHIRYLYISKTLVYKTHNTRNQCLRIVIQYVHMNTEMK